MFIDIESESCCPSPTNETGECQFSLARKSHGCRCLRTGFVSQPTQRFNLFLYSLVYQHPTSSVLMRKLNLVIKHEVVWISYMAGLQPKPGEKKQNDRSYYMCPCTNASGPCCYEKLNNNGSLAYHHCEKLSTLSLLGMFAQHRASIQSPQFKCAIITKKNEDVINLLVAFFAGTAVSHLIVGGHKFNRLIQGLIQLGQKHPTIPSEQLVPYISRERIPQLLLAKAQDCLLGILERLQGKNISVMFDGGTVNHHHYLAVCFAELEADAHPQFLQLSYGPSSKEDYVAFLAEIVFELRKWNISISTICTDGLPAQVQAIDQYQESLVHVPSIPPSKPEQNSPAKVRPVKRVPRLIPFHVPCFNHRVNNVLKHSIEDVPFLSQLVESLKSFSNEANKKDYHLLLKKVCPTFIVTRWLCLSMMASYVRLKRKSIVDNRLANPSFVLETLKLEIVLLPLMELQLYFESHETKLGYVYPALLRALNQYAILAHQPEFCGEWLGAIVCIMVHLYNYTLSGETGHLVELAATLTAHGRELYVRRAPALGFHPLKSLAECAELLSNSLTSWPRVAWESVYCPATFDICEVLDELKSLSYTLSSQTVTSSSTSSSSSQASAITPSPSADFPPDEPLHSGFDIVEAQPKSLLFSLSRDNRRSLTTNPSMNYDDDALEMNAANVARPRSSFFLGLPTPAKKPPPDAVKEDADKGDDVDTAGAPAPPVPPPKLKEKALMSLLDMVHLLRELHSDEQYCEQEPEDIDEDAFVVYGDIAKRVKARHRRLLELQQCEPPMQQTTTTTSSSSSSSSSSGSGIIQILDDDDDSGDDDDVIIVAAEGTIQHKSYSSDADEMKCAEHVFQSLTDRASQTLLKDFQSQLDRILPKDAKEEKDAMMMEFKRYITMRLPSVDPVEQTLRFTCPLPPLQYQLFCKIVKALINSVCSESPCERVLSAVRNMCGDKKTNLEIHTLNHSLLAKFYGKP